jgi:NAD(P)-dependent dehydrogenase (short-subunit alcohol dehydrogenase family)
MRSHALNRRVVTVFSVQETSTQVKPDEKTVTSTQASDRNYEFFQYNNLPYQSSKAAVNVITVAFAKELAGTPIKVNAADPGFTDTDFNNHRGSRTVEQAATVIVHLATLGEDGPTGSFQDENGNIPW